MSVRVLLADDHNLVRQGLKALLERQGFHVVCEASNGQEALRLAAKDKPDVAIIDISMPVMNGVDAAREMTESSPKTNVILLTQHDEDQYVTEALRAGVKGYMLKNQAADDFVHAIREVCRGSVYLSPGISRTVLEAYLSKTYDSTDPLSGCERQVLQLVGEEKSTKDVAVLLGISVKTAESHRARLMKKLDIHETASLVRYAIRRGLIQACPRPGRVTPQTLLGHFTQSKWVIHRIEIIWQPAMLQGEERAASVIRAPTSNTPTTKLH